VHMNRLASPTGLAAVAATAVAAVAGAVCYFWRRSSSRQAAGRRHATVRAHAVTGSAGGSRHYVFSEADARQLAQTALARGAGDTLEITYGPLPVEGTHIIVAAYPTLQQLKAAGPSLEAVLVPFAGLPPQLKELLLGNRSEFSQEIAVYSTHHNAAFTAELAVALCLSAAKLLQPADALLRRNDWSARGIPADPGSAPQPMPMLLLAGKTALVLGFGQVGKRVAAAMMALGMRLIATRATAAHVYTTPEGVTVYPTSALAQLLPCAHVVFVCVPSTPMTDGLLGSKELKLLPEGAVLVNVGRGSVVDEEALESSLRPGGNLLAAGIDVWYNYPADHTQRNSTPPSRRRDFAPLENLVMSPHRCAIFD
jgi:phosphoglycerate dehydrogenase-like enzyme